MDELTVLCEPLQWTHLQWPLLRMSPTAGDETSRGRNPENGRRQDFGRRQLHQQSGFQHTDRPRPSSLELFNKDHDAGRESLSHQTQVWSWLGQFPWLGFFLNYKTNDGRTLLFRAVPIDFTISFCCFLLLYICITGQKLLFTSVVALIVMINWLKY